MLDAQRLGAERGLKSGPHGFELRLPARIPGHDLDRVVAPFGTRDQPAAELAALGHSGSSEGALSPCIHGV